MNAPLLLLTGALTMGLPPPDPVVERALDALHLRAGAPADLRQRDAALNWLLAHAERAFPSALARLQATPADLPLLDFVGRCRRPDATPLLLRAFASPATRAVAAAGLGQSPDPQARQALLAALDASDPGLASAAMGGLAASGDTGLCGEIVARLQSADADLRWMALDAGLSLGCLDEATLQTIARDDPDAAVRARAARR